MALRIRIIRCAAELKRMAGNNLYQAKRRYGRDHHNRVWIEPAFTEEDYFPADRTPLTTIAIEQLATENYSKPYLRRLGPYRIVIVRPEVICIIRDGIENIVSIDPVICTTQSCWTTEGIC